jgi:hypothetical protein
MLPPQVVRLASKEHARQAACECRALERLGPETDVADTHVAPLLGLLRDKSHLYIVLPYFEAGDLFSRVVESNAGQSPPTPTPHLADPPLAAVGPGRPLPDDDLLV